MSSIFIFALVVFIAACGTKDPYLEKPQKEDPEFVKCYENEQKAGRVKEEVVKTTNKDETITYSFIENTRCEPSNDKQQR